jgi:hypothetical protein
MRSALPPPITTLATVAKSNLPDEQKTRIRSWWEREMARDAAHEESRLARVKETTLASEAAELAAEEIVTGATGYALGMARATLGSLDVKVPLLGNLSVDALVAGLGAAGSLAAGHAGSKWLAAASRHVAGAATAIRFERLGFEASGRKAKMTPPGTAAHGEQKDPLLEELASKLG